MFDYRYHVVTIIAIFLALGLGILIGVTIADSLVNRAESGLRGSLQDDLEAARSDRADAVKELRIREDFEHHIYPSLVEDALAARRIGVVAVGSLDEGVVTDVRDTLDPSGAKLAVIGAFEAPVPVGRVLKELPKRALGHGSRQVKTANELGELVGRELVRGGGVLRRADRRLFSARSGSFGALDAVIYVREKRSLTGVAKKITDRFESGLLEGMTDQKIAVVGVEQVDTEPSQINYYRDHDLTSVDDVDLVAGRVALVFALLGAKGQFGTKATATQLVPRTQLAAQ